MLIGLSGDFNNILIVLNKRELSFLQVRKKRANEERKLTPSCPVTISNIFLPQSTEPATQWLALISHRRALPVEGTYGIP